jgi:hypothetical protein
MSEVSSPAAAVALIEKIELWREFAFGHKDLRANDTSIVPKGDPRSFELLQRLFEIYCGRSRGMISDHVWSRLVSVLSTLQSTAHFRAQWDAVKADFPEEFRALIQSVRA